MPPPRRLRRFLHLERPRAAAPAAEPTRERAGDAEERIANVERPAAPAPGPQRSRTGARLERFGPEPEPALELVETEGRRPFIRCRRCGGDNNVFATACQGCGLSLDTPEQHEFDEQFWARRQAEAEREARAAQERRELQARAEAEEARTRHAAAEELAREVGSAERRRLSRLGLGGGARGPWEPLGMRAIRRLVPDERWHPLALGAAAGAAGALCGLGVHLGSAVLAVAGAAALVALLIHAPE